MRLLAAAAALTAVLPASASAGPYPPAAGQPGSTAIPSDDPRIVAWATGWLDYLPGSDVDAVWQAPEEALGRAEGDEDGDPVHVVPLGRRGSITLTFDQSIVDGPGPDFAVFENAFNDRFLELGHVEVSADGAEFVRFPSDSLTAGPVAAFAFQGVDPTDVDGLAGKHRAGFGTPFDLEDVGLDRAIRVRIVDVVGDGADVDSGGDPIYDPYPTVGSAGFDLDGVAVLHAAAPAVSSFAEWRGTAFSPEAAADDAESGPMADPDADGCVNLLEYGARTDPLSSAEAHRPSLRARSEGGPPAPTFRFVRPRTVTDLRLTVETSDDASDWRIVASWTGEGGWVMADPESTWDLRELDDGGAGAADVSEIVPVEVVLPAHAGSRMLRLRAELLDSSAGTIR